MNDPLKFPIGECTYPEVYTDELLKKYKLDIETFPMRLENVVQHLDEAQLRRRYREGGWTINQVVHHCADSHTHCLLRIKFALSLDNPTIIPYPEDLWAEMADYDLPFNNSMTLLYAMHRKIIKLLNSLDDAHLERSYYHPQYQRKFTIKDVMCLYAWHGNHHLAHILRALSREQ